MQAVQRVGLEEAMTHLIDLINAAMRGEDVVIVKDERSMVKLVPMPLKPGRRAGSANGIASLVPTVVSPLGKQLPLFAV